MATRFSEMQPVLSYAAAHLDDDVSLDALAARAGLSRFHLHRIFSATLGETPKQFTFRLRLGRAAVLLLTSRESVLNVALSCGFQSHEAFSRAFRRRFGMTPKEYRARGFVTATGRAAAQRHAEAVNTIGHCVGLYHLAQEDKLEKNEMTYSIARTELEPQPVLVVRRRVKRSEIAATIASSLPQIFQYAQQNGIALAGRPFTRYVQANQGMVTMEPGMRVASGQNASPAGGSGVVSDTLPGGPAATTTHTGPYEQLQDAYAAVEQWMEAQDLKGAGAPWEVYLTDPGDYPDPKDWKTGVFWPVTS